MADASTLADPTRKRPFRHRVRKSSDPVARFAQHVVSGYGGTSSVGSECWVWIGSSCPKGYGRFGVGRGKSPAMAHRFAWEARNGPIPDGLELDHLCRNPSCVNPDHLEPVTGIENRARSSARGAPLLRGDICHRGHDTRVTGLYVTESARRCRECCREYDRDYYRARREAR